MAASGLHQLQGWGAAAAGVRIVCQIFVVPYLSYKMTITQWFFMLSDVLYVVGCNVCQRWIYCQILSKMDGVNFCLLNNVPNTLSKWVYFLSIDLLLFVSCKRSLLY